MPSGRELAHTEWRLHDLGQYLWNVGDGRFLLRRHDALTLLAPLGNLAAGNAFAEQTFLHFNRRIEAIVVSANRDLLSIESIKRETPKTSPASKQTVSQTVPTQTVPTQTVPTQTVSTQTVPTQTVPSQTAPSQSSILSAGLQRRDPNQPKPDPTPTQVDFFRLLKTAASPSTSKPESASTASSRLLPRLDGRIYTPTPVNVPLTTEGFLRTKASTRDGVLLDFLTFTGKDLDLGDFATSCPPHPTFVSPSEFVAFGCRGAAESLDLAGFNLRGDFLWQINFDDEQAYPSFASSIPAGRFAFSRTVTATHVFGNETPSMSQLQAQEVRVVQMYNGRQLLKVVTSPIQRAGQNFALSPDGLSLAVLHDNATSKGDVITHQTSIEIYKLPPLTDKDLAQIKLELAMAPAPADVHMRFSADEIKAALAAKPEHSVSDEPEDDPHATTPADSRIAGDPIPPPATAATAPPPKSGTIPTSDVAETPASPPSAPADPSAADLADNPTGKRRKPPTLYEPAPPQ